MTSACENGRYSVMMAAIRGGEFRGPAARAGVSHRLAHTPPAAPAIPCTNPRRVILLPTSIRVRSFIIAPLALTRRPQVARVYSSARRGQPNA